ncbi:MAG: helix-turn-helix transcriptional regulator, partial [Acutalibacteraceae bacterium]|nr:helix-turn-helix transcriptional regulator [Acutalibacteraceae bacterium]
YERGVITPSLNIIFDIADGLNMTLDEFFGFTPPKQHTLEEEVLLNYFNAADEKARDIIIEASRTISKAYPADTE